MKERYDRIAAQDETKKKIAEVRKEMFMHEGKRFINSVM